MTDIRPEISSLPASDRAELALRWVREAPELNYDTESSGIDWKVNFPVGYVIGASPAEVVYVPVRHGGGGNLPDPKVKTPQSATDPLVVHRFERELAKAFKDRAALPKDKGLIIGHHIKFDCHMSANAGIMLGRNLTCTQNNEALLNEYARSFSLDSCAKAHGVTEKKGDDLYAHLASMFGGEAARSAMQHYWKTSGDDPIALDYATGDGTSTHELYRAQLAEIIQSDIEDEERFGPSDMKLINVFHLENELIWTLFRMERRGIKVNEEYLQRLLVKIENRVQDAQKILPEDFNPRSPLDMKKWVTKAGHTDWPTTEKGNPSFTEKWLKSFPEGKAVVTLRKWTNLANTFVTPMLKEHMHKGRVHATLNQLKADDTGTVSGRLSCSDPNLQQIPKRDKELAALFRKAFEADDGMEFYEADYSQCEPRLYAHYSQEPVLIQGYTKTPFEDVHDAVAKLLGVERDPTAKRMNMGMFTGMFPKTFAGHMEWPIELATEKWNAWQSAFPGIAGFQRRGKEVLIARGYVKTLLGRRGRLESTRFAYRAVSKIIQGGNADILKYMMVYLDRMCEEDGDQTHLLMTVHDAFEWQSPKTAKGQKFSKTLLGEMIRVQEPPFNLRIPFVVEADSGPDWATATFGVEKLNKILAEAA